MDKHIKNLSYVISNGSMENTYKMGWVRSLVDFSIFNTNTKLVCFDDLSRFIFGYYWNQTIFFNLEQSPNPLKRPVIHQIAIDKINQYQKKYGYQPVFFTKVENKIDVDYPKISKVLNQDVCWRFPSVGKEKFDFYDLDRDNLKLTLYRPDLLKEYSDVLYELINYRWTQKLEEVNSSPRISLKVRGTDREKIRRKPLKPFRKYLDQTNPRRISFITGKPISESDLSVDHVIPWSYLYSDDLWNLVYVERGENSSKSNRIPDEEMIGRLERRNKKLMRVLESKGIHDKHAEELKLSLEKDYVRKFWVGFKG
jgi:hypothetical protein